MKDTIRCVISCILPCGALDVIRVVHCNGRVEEISGSVLAGDIMKAHSKHVLKKPSSSPSDHGGVVPQIVIVPPDAETALTCIFARGGSGSSNPRPMPIREDCWSEAATSTLIESWGRRYVEVNRGNLRQKDWQDVADAVNALHGLTKKTHRTDVQCKNRVDTIKKKYKVEKARVSSWSFFPRLDSLIGSTAAVKKPPPPPPSVSPSPPLAVPLPIAYRKPDPATQIVALPQKRSAAMNEGLFRMNYSAVAAAAAAENEDDDDEEEEEDNYGDAESDGGEIGSGEGVKRLAKAIERFGEVYERVEADKIRQMVDLEKQRMQFAKDLEVQRMRMFVDTQVQLERLKHGKRPGSNDIYS